MGILRRFFSRESTGFATTDDVGTQYALLKTTRRRGRWHVLLGAPPSAEFRRPAVLITTHKRRIREYLAQRDYDAAEAYYRTVRHCYAQPAYQAVRQHYWQLHRDEVLSALHELLSEFRFKEANELAAGSIVVVEPEEYQNALKAPAIQKFFGDNFSFDLNTEQAKALASPAQHVLVKARAGTGKTRAIVSKAILAMYEEGLHPDQILMLAFNRDAANEMLDRMRSEFEMPEFSTSKTFHSLAYRIALPGRSIPDSDDVRLQLLEKALRSVWTNAFRKLVNTFFRMAEDVDLLPDRSLDAKNYYQFRRTDLKLFTLGGAKVKSIGEKWIADFLFEHGIFYGYEEYFRWDGEPYHPDFTLKASDQGYKVIAILEHWGVSADDQDEDAIFDGGTTARQYRMQIKRKRSFWKGKGITLVETSLDDMTQGRAAFENILRDRLEAIGIPCKRLSDGALEQRLERRYWNELTKLMLQFVDRAKNRRLKVEDVRRVHSAVPKHKVRTRVFWRLASRVYGAYERILRQENKMDFQDVLEEAAQRIEAEHGDLAFVPERGRNPVRLDGLRWLLIDEYQDFSPGFDNMVRVLRKYNPGLRLFCVGDDWQTINRFAGSEPIYFQEFAKKTPEAQEVLLRINHRSRREIVNTSNRLMEGFGAPGMWLPNKLGGQVRATCVDRLYLKALPTNGAHGTDFEGDEDEECPRKFDPGFMRAKTIAVCCGLIERYSKPGSSVAILSRTNHILRLPLFRFAEDLYMALEEIGAAIDPPPSVNTVHKFKGLQAELVILLDVTSGQVPLLHKDNELMAPFLSNGADPHEEAMIDERRLFYVALSRATDHLWILSESARLSPFLESLGVPIVDPTTVAAQPFGIV